jgi:hypothetical protein
MQHENFSDDELIISMNNSFPVSLLKLSSIFMGNVELESDYRLTANNFGIYLITFLFIFIMPIFLYNLFIGIAIEEINDVLRDAEIKTIQLRIEYVLKIQNICEKFRFECLQNRIIIKYVYKTTRKSSFKIIKEIAYKLFGFFSVEFDLKYQQNRETTLEDLKTLINDSERTLRNELNSLKNELKTIKFDTRINLELKEEIKALKTEIRNLRSTLPNSSSLSSNDDFA